MANMSYCRFRNTKNDLADCVYTLEDMTICDAKDLSIEEKRAADAMYNLCQEYINLYDELKEKDVL